MWLLVLVVEHPRSRRCLKKKLGNLEQRSGLSGGHCYQRARETMIGAIGLFGIQGANEDSEDSQCSISLTMSKSCLEKLTKRTGA